LQNSLHCVHSVTRSPVFIDINITPLKRPLRTSSSKKKSIPSHLLHQYLRSTNSLVATLKTNTCKYLCMQFLLELPLSDCPPSMLPPPVHRSSHNDFLSCAVIRIPVCTANQQELAHRYQVRAYHFGIDRPSQHYNLLRNSLGNRSHHTFPILEPGMKI
jgi:hypothetical protein